MSDVRPTHLDLFSGIGGFALAARWAGFRTVAFCEIDAYCQADLAARFGAVPDSAGERRREGRAESDDARQARLGGDSIPIFPNIFDFRGTDYRGVSLLTGGFPCQPFSVAGKRNGAEDDRHLWPEMLRVIDEARPAFVLGENVPGIISMELDNVLSDLEAIGYACRSLTIPACAVDARHRRDRLWIVAHNEERRWGNGSTPECREHRTVGRSQEQTRGCSRLDDANALCGSQGRPTVAWGECCEWEPEPSVGRVAHGVPNRVDRLRGLGNAIVPQVAFEILKAIRGML